VTSSLRRTLSHSLCHAVSPYYRWLWTNRTWVGDPLDSEWKEDGPFHWYSYQWTTRIPSTIGYALSS
jgi:hypothetical protein